MTTSTNKRQNLTLCRRLWFLQAAAVRYKKERSAMFDRKAHQERIRWYQEARFGMFIHWGLYSIPARGNGSGAMRGSPSRTISSTSR